jgi:hypothetical protein
MLRTLRPAEALEIAHAAVASRTLRIIVFSDHALERMPGRSASAGDVEEAIRTADVAVQSEHGANRWELHGGCDLDECGLVPVVAIDIDDETHVTVVTILYPG